MSIGKDGEFCVFIKNSDAKDLHVYKTVKCILDLAEDNISARYIYVDKKYATGLSNLAKDKRVIFYDAKVFKTKELKGKNVCVIKAGNLVTKEWFIKAIKLDEDNKILVPESEFLFGYNRKQSILKYQAESLETLQLGQLICGEGTFVELLFCKKTTLVELVGSPSEIENAYTIGRVAFEKKISFEIIPDTIVFARQLTTTNKGTKENLLDMKLFPAIRNKLETILAVTPQKHTKRSIKNNSLYVKFRDIKIVIFAVKVIKKLLRKGTTRRVPKDYIAAWRHVNYLESSLYPDAPTVEHISIRKAIPNQSLFKAYYDLARELEDSQIKYLFFVPWVVRGGGDKVLINYLKAFEEKHPDWQVAVVPTQPSKNEWAKFLPDNAVFIDFRKKATGLSIAEKEILFSRLVSATKCKYLHIINSAYAFDWIIKNDQALKKCKYSIRANLFCYDYVPGTNYEWRVEFADPYLVEGYDVMDYIYTDNKAIISFDTKKNGFDDKKFKVHYQPVTEAFLKPKKIPKAKKLKILWASRIAEQKLPYVLAEIGKKLDKNIASIDVYGYFYDDLPKKLFSGIESISYKGSFNGLQSIDVENYDLFLYTSIIDGVPNIILEAIAAGLPVIASDSGGINEVVKNKETGLLVKNVMRPDEYVEAIETIKNSPDIAEKYANNAQEMLRKQHSWEGYSSEVENDIIDMIK